MKLSRAALNTLRPRLGELGNHALDEFAARRLTRRKLLRYLSVLGVSGANAAIKPGPAVSGGTLRVALLTPVGALDPLTVSDAAGTALVAQTGEHLINDDGARLMLTPALPTSWLANANGTVWTFKLRQGVRFHGGQPFSARDVVATFDRLTDPHAGSAALSVFKGVLSKGGVRALDPYTVAFHLDAPTGSFPYYVSSDNYNSVMLPAGYGGGYEKSFPGTGPFRLEQYQPRRGASFVRNPDYWGQKALPDRVRFAFYADSQAQILALQGREADIMNGFTLQGGLGLLNNPAFTVLGVKSSAHRQMHLRCDRGPFRDKRVRQALALSLNREVLVRGLFRGRASVGNDSPFAPVFDSTDTQVAQRRQDLAQARRLLAEAGAPAGFKTSLTTERFMEIPDYAIVVQDAAKAISIDVTLKLESQQAYYGGGMFDSSDWLNAEVGITDYGHRGAPDLFLGAPLKSNGAWNAAHFRNLEYGRLLAEYVAALDVSTQRRLAGQIQTLLLDETPLVIAYFYDALIATAARVSRVRFTALSQLYLDRARIA